MALLFLPTPSYHLFSPPIPYPCSGLVVTKQIGTEEGTACKKLWTWRNDEWSQRSVWKGFLALAETNSNTVILTQLTCLCQQLLCPLGWGRDRANIFQKGKNVQPLELEFSVHGYGNREEFWIRDYPGTTEKRGRQACSQVCLPCRDLYLEAC